MSRRWLLPSLLVAVLCAGAAFAAGARGARRQAAPAPDPVRRDAPRAAAVRDSARADGSGASAGRGVDHGGDHGGQGREGGHGGHHGGGGAIDWGRISERDLDVASVFLVARDSGVRRGLDRLRALAARDPRLHAQGHVVAHALGRFAVGRNGHDPAVYAECREDFQAGCYHGVLEGYLTSPRAAGAGAVEPRALAALCPAILPPGPARLPLLECAHGMGHGLTARAGNDYRRALRSCDALAAPDARAECHDGVFMEVAVRGTEPRAGTNDGTLLRRGDLRYPCDSVAGAYQPSCWKYQPIVAYEFTRDLARTRQLCDEAPAASAASCYHGLGKQSVGWAADARGVVAACGTGAARLVGACLAGAAESYIDEAWTTDRALALCRASPDAAKDACYAAVGERIALIRPDAASVARECAGAERRYVDACVGGATRRRP